MKTMEVWGLEPQTSCMPCKQTVQNTVKTQGFESPKSPKTMVFDNFGYFLVTDLFAVFGNHLFGDLNSLVDLRIR